MFLFSGKLSDVKNMYRFLTAQIAGFLFYRYTYEFYTELSFCYPPSMRIHFSLEYSLILKIQCYAKWLDQRAYTQLSKQLSPDRIEKILFSIEQQVVQRDERNILQDISFCGSLWNQGHTLQDGSTIKFAEQLGRIALLCKIVYVAHHF